MTAVSQKLCVNDDSRAKLTPPRSQAFAEHLALLGYHVSLCICDSFADALTIVVILRRTIEGDQDTGAVDQDVQLIENRSTLPPAFTSCRTYLVLQGSDLCVELLHLRLGANVSLNATGPNHQPCSSTQYSLHSRNDLASTRLLLGLCVNLLGRLLQHVLSSTSDVHLGSIDSKALRDHASDPGAAAGDDDDFAFNGEEV